MSVKYIKITILSFISLDIGFYQNQNKRLKKASAKAIKKVIKRKVKKIKKRSYLHA